MLWQNDVQTFPNFFLRKLELGHFLWYIYRCFSFHPKACWNTVFANRLSSCLGLRSRPFQIYNFSYFWLQWIKHFWMLLTILLKGVKLIVIFSVWVRWIKSFIFNCYGNLADFISSKLLSWFWLWIYKHILLCNETLHLLWLKWVYHKVIITSGWGAKNGWVRCLTHYILYFNLFINFFIFNHQALLWIVKIIFMIWFIILFLGILSQSPSGVLWERII